jgi:hypothetical protein
MSTRAFSKEHPMLSRSTIIHRSAGEAEPRKRTSDSGRPSNGELLKNRLGWRTAVAAVFVGLFVAFVFLNRNGVVEPRIDMLLARYDRPALLPVLLLTSLVSIVGTLMVRGALDTRRRLGDARARSLTELIELEASRIKHGSVARPANTA